MLINHKMKIILFTFLLMLSIKFSSLHLMNGLIMCSIFKLEGNEGTPFLVFSIISSLYFLINLLFGSTAQANLKLDDVYLSLIHI